MTMTSTDEMQRSNRACLTEQDRDHLAGFEAMRDLIREIGLNNHYRTMPMGDIKALSVVGLAARNAHLYLWTTNAFIEEAHEVARGKRLLESLISHLLAPSCNPS